MDDFIANYCKLGVGIGVEFNVSPDKTVLFRLWFSSFHFYFS